MTNVLNVAQEYAPQHRRATDTPPEGQGPQDGFCASRVCGTWAGVLTCAERQCSAGSVAPVLLWVLSRRQPGTGSKGGGHRPV